MSKRQQESEPLEKVIETYLMLVEFATKTEKITYGHIGGEFGVAARAVGGILLDPISYYCRNNGLPNLTSIVVRKDTGEPGDRYMTRETPQRDREKVYAFPWRDHAPRQLKS